MFHVVHLSNNYGIIAGSTKNPPYSRINYTSIIYLVNFNSSNRYLIIVDQYIPNATSATWQDLLTNSNANLYSPKYDMSVSVNQYNYILVSMQYINRVFFLSVSLLKPNKLTFIDRFTNGRCLGLW